jgi:2-keto-4-pentenoate hydratase/2-oxohepta-3-ene-1,7-dioic acid hydratase in catechol pathway
MMRFLSFETDGGHSFGAAVDGGVVDLGRRPDVAAKSLREAIAMGALAKLAELAASSRPDMAQDDVKFLPVIPDPAKILCIGLNYETHRLETGRQVVGHPTVFTRFADTQIGHRGQIVAPKVSRSLDYEGELAVIIGQGGRYIAEADAFDHVAGYACYNDATLRDWQSHTHQFTPGKNFPTTGPFGPYLVTPDDVGVIGPQRIRTRLNGETVQSATLGEMIFSIPVLINYVSSFTPLRPGDVICTGTPGGVGAKREPPLFMKPGDRVEVEIDGVGLLASSIVSED